MDFTGEADSKGLGKAIKKVGNAVGKVGNALPKVGQVLGAAATVVPGLGQAAAVVNAGAQINQALRK
jgi:hypothetical protein